MNTASSSAGDPLHIQSWMDVFLNELQNIFENRLIFVGLQGSRGRGEGRPDSDIDVVVVLDALTSADLEVYGELLDRLPYRKLVCGFVSGRAELAAWERSELFQFARDTRPWLGSLADILPPVEREDVRRAVHAGACGIYHAAVHNLLHDRSVSLLQDLYKQAGFTLQAKHFYDAGEDLTRSQDLLLRLGPEERTILEGREQAAALSSPELPAFRELSHQLLAWSSRLIVEYTQTHI